MKESFKSYAEYCGLSSMNWLTFLNGVIKAGITSKNRIIIHRRNPKHYLKLNLKKSSDLIKSWKSCAIGSLDYRIPREPYKFFGEHEGERIESGGEPLDQILRELGIQFMCLIEESKWIEAKKILILINKRGNIILKMMEQDRKNNDILNKFDMSDVSNKEKVSTNHETRN